MKFLRYEWKDFLELDVREDQKEIIPYQNEVTAKRLEQSKYMYSVYAEDGRFIAVGGLKHIWYGRAEMFVICSKSVTIRDFVDLTTFGSELGNIQEYKRIEAVTCADNEKNIAWLEKLGFERECLMKKYGLKGEDNYLYVRIK